MRQITREELLRNIAIQLRVLRGPVKTALQRVHGDMAADTAAALIVERCLGGCVVFAPDRYHPAREPGHIGSWGDAHGKFGATEPYPEPPPESAHSGRCLLCTANDIDGLALALAEAMWLAIEPKIPFDRRDVPRGQFLLMAQRALNKLAG